MFDDWHLPDAPPDCEPDEPVDGRGDGEPVVQAVGGSVPAEHDRGDVVPAAGPDLCDDRPRGIGGLRAFDLPG